MTADAGRRMRCQCLFEDWQCRTFAAQQVFDGLARCTGIAPVVLHMLSMSASSRRTADGVLIMSDARFVVMRGQTCLDTPGLAVNTSSPGLCMVPHLVMLGSVGFCQGCCHIKPVGIEPVFDPGHFSADQETSRRVVLERNRRR